MRGVLASMAMKSAAARWLLARRTDTKVSAHSQAQ
jgi:hypothetical protein